MPTAYEAALAKLKGSSENVEELKSTFPPTLKIHDKKGEGIGKYVSGVLKSRRMVLIKGKPAPVYTLKLSETNATATKKEGEKWVPAEVKTGDDVSLFSPTRLDRILKELGPGASVIIHYDGKKPIMTPRGEVETHMFTVHGSKSGKEFALTTENVAPTPEPTNGDKATPAVAAAGTPEADPFA